MGRYRPPAPQSSKYITPEGAATLREELEFLWRRKRPEVTRAVAEAAAQGDRSENAEYIYGKKQLGEIDRRVRYLRKRLEGIHVVDQVPSDTSKVFFGAWFELRDPQDRVQSFRLVGPDEFDRDPAYISIDSPVARALLKKAVDDEVEVQGPDGPRHLEIVSIRYEEPT